MCDHNDDFYIASNNAMLVNNRFAPTPCQRFAHLFPNNVNNDHEWIFDIPNAINARLYYDFFM